MTNDLRDARLHRALAEAPDHNALPHPTTRAAIAQAAHAAVAEAAAVTNAAHASAFPGVQHVTTHRPEDSRLVRWRNHMATLWTTAGRARTPWSGAFASLLLATVITLLWVDQPDLPLEPAASVPHRSEVKSSTHAQDTEKAQAAAPAQVPSPQADGDAIGKRPDTRPAVVAAPANRVGTQSAAEFAQSAQSPVAKHSADLSDATVAAKSTPRAVHNEAGLFAEPAPPLAALTPTQSLPPSPRSAVPSEGTLAGSPAPVQAARSAPAMALKHESTHAPQPAPQGVQLAWSQVALEVATANGRAWVQLPAQLAPEVTAQLQSLLTNASTAQATAKGAPQAAKQLASRAAPVNALHDASSSPSPLPSLSPANAVPPFARLQLLDSAGAVYAVLALWPDRYRLHVGGAPPVEASTDPPALARLLALLATPSTP